MDDAPIRFETATRAEAESLQHVLDGFESRLARDGKAWVVEVLPDAKTTPLLVQLFHAIGNWLSSNGRASVRVHFGDRAYTLMRPSDMGAVDSAELLLERVIQLQTALDTRVLIEQAKGILAARRGLGIEEAFDVLRRAARRAGRRLHDLAQEVVDSGDIPEAVRHSLAKDEHQRGPFPPSADGGGEAGKLPAK